MSTTNDQLVTVEGLSAYTEKLKTKLATKVDKVANKGLSTNDFTTEEKEKLASLAAHPTTTAHTAAAVKVGNDANGHVVIGDAITAADVGAASASHTHGIDDIDGLETTLSGFVTSDKLGVANGVATLGADGKLTASQLPSLAEYDDVVEIENVSQLTEDFAESGKLYITPTNEVYRWAATSKTAIKVGSSSGGKADISASEWSDVTSHVASKSNPHGVTAAQVGLGNVDNTSDANKPISTATQAALDNKLNKFASETSTTATAAQTVKSISQGVDGSVSVEVQDIAIGMSAVSGLSDALAGKASTDTFSSAADGLVPKPTATTATNAYLGADGAWRDLPENKDTTYTNGDGINLVGTTFSAKVDGTTVKINASKQLSADISITQGTNVTVTGDSATGYTISATDTTYTTATASAAGLMSAADKDKLDGMSIAPVETVAALLDDETVGG